MHRYTTNNGINFIKQFEGFKASPYLCAGGFLTIGYGHKLTQNEEYKPISIERGEGLLKKDLFTTEHAVLRYVNVELTDYQFDALVSFTFNLGAATLQRSTLRQKLNYGLYNEAKDEFLKWIYADGKALRGLVRRRAGESLMFGGNVY